MIAATQVYSYNKSERGIVLNCDGPCVSITVLTSGIIRIRFAPDGRFSPRRTWSVVTADSDFPQTSFKVEDTEQRLLITTDLLTAHIEKNPLRISFTDAIGHVFCADQEEMSSGRAISRMHGDPPSYSFGGQNRVYCAKHIEENEHFYGFGERTGPLDKLGRLLVNWTADPPAGHGSGTDPLYAAIPTLLVLRPGLAYGIFFNNTWRSYFNIGRSQANTWTMEAEGGEIDYYVVYGPTPFDVNFGFTRLLGKMPLPPRWSLGYHQSRWSYHNEALVREIATEFRSRKLPCDSIHLDIDYMNEYRVFTWDRLRFPNPLQLFKELHGEGFRVVAIVNPGVKVDDDFEVYQQGLRLDAFIYDKDGALFSSFLWSDKSVFPDFTLPVVRQWWGDLQNTLIQEGVDGIWNDMNEPTCFNNSYSSGGSRGGTIDLDAKQGSSEERTLHAEVHNLYGQEMAQASYEGLRRQLKGERPFVMSRSGFAGLQRWSCLWTGDNSPWWEHLEMALPQMMNLGISGVPFVGTDIGGFFGRSTPNLFARWMQVGCISPFCRGHSSLYDLGQEPWVFGEYIEEICRKYLALRYRLLPYLYTLFWEAFQFGTPVLRPVFYHFPDDPMTYNLHDQVLLGLFIMAAPICEPDHEYRSVYLPEGKWYDWWTDEVVNGPSHILVHAPLESMPLYIREGAIIPSGPDLYFCDEKPLSPLFFDLYPGDAIFTFYEDDGHSLDYEEGLFSTRKVSMHLTTSSEDKQMTLCFNLLGREGNFIPPKRNIILRFHDVGPRHFPLSSNAEYNQVRHILTISIEDDGNPYSVNLTPIAKGRAFEPGCSENHNV